jgi:hypothetical protein
VRPSWLVTLPLAVLFAQGCIHENGLEYDQLTIQALRADGSSVARFPKCFTMPVLHGSVVEERHPIESGAVILVHATDSVIEIDFEGVVGSTEQQRSITLDDLKAGYSEALSVESTSGPVFSVRLSQGCR